MVRFEEGFSELGTFGEVKDLRRVSECSVRFEEGFSEFGTFGEVKGPTFQEEDALR